MDLLQAYGESSESEGESTQENDFSGKTETIRARPPDRRYLNAAPQTSALAMAEQRSQAIQIRAGSNEIRTKTLIDSTGVLLTNPLKADLLAPLQGPQIPPELNRKTDLARGHIANTETNVAFDEFTFHEQRTTFQKMGVALAPDETGTVVRASEYGHQPYGHRKRYLESQVPVEETMETDEQHENLEVKAISGDDVDDHEMNISKTTEVPPIKKNRKEREEALVQGSDDELIYGVWGPPSSEEIHRQNDKLTDLQKVGGVIESLPAEIRAERAFISERDRRRGTAQTDENGNIVSVPDSREKETFDRLVERKMAHLLPPALSGEEPVPFEASTKFHCPGQEYNYKGESWIAPPAGLQSRKGLPILLDDPDVVAEQDTAIEAMADHACYIPKKCVARMTGHNKGVHRIRLFPLTGHLLLSAGLDGKCKIWSVQEKKVMRTYIGHSAGVRDIQFNNDGTEFLSASFDRFIRLWNTESGVVLGTFTNRRVPYVVQFYPPDNNFFCCGCSDNKIVTYDIRSGEIVQEYNHHLAPVNTITFVNEGEVPKHGTTKMITSSDDKKIIIWDWDTPVPLKTISDPSMHSIPVITLHPSLSYFLGQSLDNKIVVYQAKDRFTLQRKMQFSGHHIAGYACDISCSPDGRFICCGDGDGKLIFWDFKRQRYDFNFL